MNRFGLTAILLLAFADCASAQKITRGDEMTLVDARKSIDLQKGDRYCGKYFALMSAAHSPGSVERVVFMVSVPIPGKKKEKRFSVGTGPLSGIRTRIDPSKQVPTIEFQTINDTDIWMMVHINERDLKRSFCLPSPE